MEKGVLAGYPVTDVRVTLYDGSFHEVDSSDFAFKIAGSIAFQEGAKRAGLILLDPIMKVEVIVPEKFLGDVVGDLSAKRGKILEMKERGTMKVVDAFVPLGEMFGYSTDLRSKSQGRATYSMQFSCYEPVPKTISEEIIGHGSP